MKNYGEMDGAGKPTKLLEGIKKDEKQEKDKVNELLDFDEVLNEINRQEDEERELRKYIEENRVFKNKEEYLEHSKRNDRILAEKFGGEIPAGRRIKINESLEDPEAAFLIRRRKKEKMEISGNDRKFYEKKNDKILKESGIADTIRSMTFDNYIVEHNWQQIAKDKAQKYAKTPKGWFLAHGASGAGKTHLCTAICGELLRKGYRVKYMVWNEDILNLKQSGDITASIVKDRINDYCKYQVLYIDDLYKKTITNADKDVLFYLINKRNRLYKEGKFCVTIISTELTLSELEAVDFATAARILELVGDNNFYLNPAHCENYRKKNMRG